MRKHSLLYLFLSLLLISILGCSNEEPVPAPVEQEGSGLTNYGFNKKDSLFIVEMLDMMEEKDAFPDDVKWDKRDVNTWTFSQWGWHDIDKEYRLVTLILSPKSGSGCTLSPKIINCTYLRELTLQCGFKEVAPEISKLFITGLCIFNTDIKELPDDIFNEDMNYVRVEFNPELTKIPSSVVELTDHPDVIDYFSFQYNGLTGEIPPITKTKIELSNNKFTSIKVSDESLTYNITCGAYAIHNNITGVVPDDILADTVKLYRLYGQVKWQNEGYGFTNMPSDDKMEEMRLEWNENHPDMKL